MNISHKYGFIVMDKGFLYFKLGFVFFIIDYRWQANNEQLERIASRVYLWIGSTTIVIICIMVILTGGIELFALWLLSAIGLTVMRQQFYSDVNNMAAEARGWNKQQKWYGKVVKAYQWWKRVVRGS